LGLKDNKEYLVFNVNRDWKPMKMFFDVRGDMGIMGKSGNEMHSSIWYSLKRMLNVLTRY